MKFWREKQQFKDTGSLYKEGYYRILDIEYNIAIYRCREDKNSKLVICIEKNQETHPKECFTDGFIIYVIIA